MEIVKTTTDAKHMKMAIKLTLAEWTAAPYQSESHPKSDIYPLGI